MTRIFLIMLTFVILPSCKRTNVLTYKHKRYYNEYSEFSTKAANDTIFKLNQWVYYNKPDQIDEEFSFDLVLIFLDSSAANKKKTLDLTSDSTLVKGYYGISSIWNCFLETENNNVSGNIEILKWDKDEIILKENIVVNDYKRNETMKFVGTRTFKREVAE